LSYQGANFSGSGYLLIFFLKDIGFLKTSSFNIFCIFLVEISSFEMDSLEDIDKKDFYRKKIYCNLFMINIEYNKYKT